MTISERGEDRLNQSWIHILKARTSLHSFNSITAATFSFTVTESGATCKIQMGVSVWVNHLLRQKLCTTETTMNEADVKLIRYSIVINAAVLHGPTACSKSDSSACLSFWPAWPSTWSSSSSSLKIVRLLLTRDQHGHTIIRERPCE